MICRGVSKGKKLLPGSLGVRAMLNDLTEFVLALAKLLIAAAIFIRSIRKK